MTDSFIFICASGSVGGARPCQGRGRGFESRLALLGKDLSEMMNPFLYLSEVEISAVVYDENNNVVAV